MRLHTGLAFIFSVTIFCSSVFVSDSSILANHPHGPLQPFKEESELVEARKKKKDKYALSLIVAALMVKAVLFPLAFKAMAVMSSVAVLMSTLSLIATSIIGYTKFAWSQIRPPRKSIRYNDGWAKDDEPIKNNADDFGYYDTIGPVEEHVHYYQRKQAN